MTKATRVSRPLHSRSQFCSMCGNIIPLHDEDIFVCRCCGTSRSYAALDPKSLKLVTKSEAKPTPKWIKAQQEALEGGMVSGDIDQSSAFRSGTVGGDSNPSVEQSRATVNETCPKCGHDRASFYTMQLRSVDEGQTVFYECLKCSNNWSQNN